MYKQIAEIIGNNEKTIYRWKKEERPVISLLEKYFKKEDLVEFLETKKIGRFENTNFLLTEVIEKNRIKYLESFTYYNSYDSLDNSHTTFINFYFEFLTYLKEDDSFYKKQFQYLLNYFFISKSSRKFDKELLDNYDEKYKEASDFYHKYHKTALEDMDSNDIDEEKEIHELAKQDALNGYSASISNNYKDMYKHFKIFNKWDYYMLLFLKECLDSDFQILYSEKDNKRLQDEALYHIRKWNEKDNS